jgi:uncharacterized protein (TIRG00374 family)
LKPWGIALRVVVTMAALWYVLHRVPFGPVRDAIAGASVPLILLGCGVQIVVRAVQAMRIRIIAAAQGAPLSYRGILATLFTTALYGLMLPGSVGAGAATLVKYLSQGATLAAALASMIVNRLLDATTNAAMGLIFWVLARRDLSAGGLEAADAVMLIGGLLVFLGVHLLLFGRPRALRRLQAWIRRFNPDQRGRAWKGVARVVDQCSMAANLSAGKACTVGLLSIGKALLTVLVAYAFAAACGVELSLATIGWMQAVVAMLVLLPISFSGLGVREGTLVFLSARYGVPAPIALSWSLLMFAGTLFVAAIGGAIELRTVARGQHR